MTIYCSELSSLKRRIADLKQQASGPQGAYHIQELCAICDLLLKMITDLASRRN
jgi:hypothetical protein